MYAVSQKRLILLLEQLGLVKNQPTLIISSHNVQVQGKLDTERLRLNQPARHR